MSSAAFQKAVARWFEQEYDKEFILEKNAICPECGSTQGRRDRKLRVHKEAGGKRYVFHKNEKTGFIKGHMCLPAISTQAEDLIA